MSANNGSYSVERKCSVCDFQTLSRDEFWQHFEAHTRPDQEPCRVCGEYLTPGGQTCYRCALSLEEDRLERESNR